MDRDTTQPDRREELGTRLPQAGLQVRVRLLADAVIAAYIHELAGAAASSGRSELAF